MGMMKNKKGVFFILLVIAIISLLAVSFAVYENFRDRDSIQKRIETMNGFIFSVEKDLSRQAYISGFRALFIVEKTILETGQFSQNVSSSMQELFFNGTINGNSDEIMYGATFTDIQNTINSNAAKMNVEIKLSSPVLAITQTDPWNVKISLQTSLAMSDKNALASWNKTETVTAFVPIDGFEDPIYAINTGGLITNNITKTPFATFVSGSDVSNLTAHVLNSLYKESSTAPSFLNRLEGKLSANPLGIESLINLQELSSQDLPIKEKSVVDYIYFSQQNPVSSQISGMPSWFRLDDAHKPDYNLS